MRPPFFHEEINGFVVSAHTVNSCYTSHCFFVFGNLQDAAEFSSEFYETKEPPNNWNWRTFGEMTQERRTHVKKTAGQFFCNLFEFKNRKFIEIAFVSSLEYMSIDWHMFDSLITKERIEKVKFQLEKAVCSHVKNFKKEIINENQY